MSAHLACKGASLILLAELAHVEGPSQAQPRPHPQFRIFQVEDPVKDLRRPP